MMNLCIVNAESSYKVKIPDLAKYAAMPPSELEELLVPERSLAPAMFDDVLSQLTLQCFELKRLDPVLIRDTTRQQLTPRCAQMLEPQRLQLLVCRRIDP